MKKTRTALRVGAAGVALGLSAFVALAASLPANAVGPADTTPTTAPTTVDPNGRGSLLVHKFDMPAGYGRDGYQGAIDNNGAGVDANGQPIDPTQYGASPLGGVTFTVQRIVVPPAGSAVPIDLTTTTGWQAATALASIVAANNTSNDLAIAAIAAAGYALADLQTGVTADGTGLAIFGDLPVGMYLVQETASVTPGTTPSAPFLVTMPLTDPNNLNAWMYQINVYPKNSLIGATKSVLDEHVAEPGQPVTWTIAVDIPHDPTI
ncbi:MAG: SpaH/EbpB family LPXTG-anchored major pilin, partial [Micrococcales bacterium]|nr:SpaH/EbpB family LPXTG-anchored major pilin [Micrococcales bacterium]